MKASEEYAAECSMVKVFASEMIDYVVDEGVQIHGGYGYHQDYPVERAYRDARINRLFEGTSEINRILITSMLLKRASRGDISILQAPEEVLRGKSSDSTASAQNDDIYRLVQNAKKAALLTLAVAIERYKTEVTKEQEITMNISDILMDVFVMESSMLRSRKMSVREQQRTAEEMTAVIVHEGLNRIRAASRAVLGRCLSGDKLREITSLLQKLVESDPVDAIQLRRNIAQKVLAAGRYSLS